ncbi:MAG: hypothetical protein AAF483_16200, partial [Planctomycetota bacterium]
ETFWGQGMSQSLDPKSFFSAFDMAFFVPGVIVFAGLLSIDDLQIDGLIAKSPENNQQKLVKEREADAKQDPAANKKQPAKLSTQLNPGSPPSPATSKLAVKPNEGAKNKLGEDSSKELGIDFRWLREISTTFSPLGVLQFVIGLVAIYIFGLSSHACSWILWTCCFKPAGRWLLKWQRLIGLLGWQAVPFDNIERDVWTREVSYYIKFADYFWYLRSTCWNSSSAIVFLGLLFSVYDERVFPVEATFCLVIALLLANLGLIFHYSSKKQNAIVKFLHAAARSEEQIVGGGSDSSGTVQLGRGERH